MGATSKVVLGLWLGALMIAPAACSGNRSRDPVSPETRQRSEEMFGRQQRSMEGFGQTPSEQAGERFEDDTRPVVPADRTPTPAEEGEQER